MRESHFERISSRPLQVCAVNKIRQQTGTFRVGAFLELRFFQSWVLVLERASTLQYSHTEDTKRTVIYGHGTKLGTLEKTVAL